MRLGPLRIGRDRGADRDLSFQQYLNEVFKYGGMFYGAGASFAGSTPLGAPQEEIGHDFVGYAQGAYKQNGVVFACMDVRLKLFSEARFQFRQLRSGRPGDYFGSPALAPLERPWPNGTTSDLLKRAIQDTDLAGNFFVARRGDRLVRLRPDWVSIILGEDDVENEVLGYALWPGGRGSGREPVIFRVEEVAHFAPIPDPEATYRGMSWLTPIVREIMGDRAATEHKLKFFENGGPAIAVKVDPDTDGDDFEAFESKFREKYEGASRWKTMILGGGADFEVLGHTFEEQNFRGLQGAGETRIAAAAGTPPVLVGLSEGLEAATYSNYSQARRRFADATMRPLWRDMAGSLSTIVEVPGGSELWYDDRDIPFLAEDVESAAKVQSSQAQTMAALVKEGWEPASVVDAVVSGDFRRLVHSGRLSVQLQAGKPGGQGQDGAGGTPGA